MLSLSLQVVDLGVAVGVVEGVAVEEGAEAEVDSAEEEVGAGEVVVVGVAVDSKALVVVEGEGEEGE